MFKKFLVCTLTALLTAGAWAGTTTIGFGAGLGPLANGNNSNLSASGGSACFSGPNTTILGSSGPLNATGSVSVQITLQPSSANPTIGITLIGNASTQLTAYTDSAGNVTIANTNGLSDTTFFSFPAALNNYMRLEYNTATDTATVFVPGGSGGERSASIQAIALDGATSFQIGVTSDGTGCIDQFVASGTSIPNYSDPAPTTVHFKLNGANQVPANASIATGCGTATLSADHTTLTLHIEHGVHDPTMAHIHLGAVGANGSVIFPFTDFTSPIDEVFTVTSGEAADFLAGNYYANVHSTNFGGGEIRGQLVEDASSCSVVVDPGPIDSDGDGTLDANDAFPYNAAGQTDSDGDGLGDEWELHYFGNLGTADGTTDTDNDGVSDLDEFRRASLGLDPTDGNTELPVLGGAGLATLAAALVVTARKRR